MGEGGRRGRGAVARGVVERCVVAERERVRAACPSSRTLTKHTMWIAANV